MWFTCTPVAFKGGPEFFTRDSGLLSRGFRQNGIESMAVLPGAATPEDEPDLIRTEYSNLESADWWRSHKLDGVVLYAWGAPRYRRVAKAIRDSGAILVLNQDCSGLISPLAGFSGWLNEQWMLNGGATNFRTLSRSVAAILKDVSFGLVRTDPLRAQHLKYGHFIAALYPEAASHFRKLCRVYGGKKLADKVITLPHAVSPKIRFDPDTAKSHNQIIAIGRWNDTIQKRPSLLMETLGLLLSSDREASIDIIGNGCEVFADWHSKLPPEQAERVVLHGKLSHQQLGALLATASIFYCPSAYESFNIAAAEALCAGCSVVSADIQTMASFRWFSGADSGTLATTDSPTAHSQALAQELTNWRTGKRSPHSISAHWIPLLHADRVAARCMRLGVSVSR